MTEKAEKSKRHYARHATDIPVNIHIEDVAASQLEYLNDISCGGMCIRSKVPIPKGTLLDVKIPLLRPVFQIKGKVVWCARSKGKGHFDVGLQFTGKCDTFKMRMAEQVCHIEEYKRKVMDEEGRKLSGTDAALEWIRKYAKEFRALDEEKK